MLKYNTYSSSFLFFSFLHNFLDILFLHLVVILHPYEDICGLDVRMHIIRLSLISLQLGCADISAHVNTADQMLFGNPDQNIPRTFAQHCASHGFSTVECFGFSKGAKTSTLWLLWPSVFTVSLNTMSSNIKKRQPHSILL